MANETTRMYSKPREYTPPQPERVTCRASTVQAVTEALVNGHVHAGTVAHVCALEKGHTEEYCQCFCNHQFRVIGPR